MTDWPDDLCFLEAPSFTVRDLPDGGQEVRVPIEIVLLRYPYYTAVFTGLDDDRLDKIENVQRGEG